MMEKPFDISAFGLISRAVRGVEDAFERKLNEEPSGSFYFALYDRTAKTFQSFTISHDTSLFNDISSEILRELQDHGDCLRAWVKDDYSKRIQPNTSHESVHLNVAASYLHLINEGLVKIFDQKGSSVSEKVWQELYFRYRLPHENIGVKLFDIIKTDKLINEKKSAFFLLKRKTENSDKTVFNAKVSVRKNSEIMKEISFTCLGDLTQRRLANPLYRFLDNYIRPVGKKKGSLTAVFPCFFFDDFIGLVFWGVSDSQSCKLLDMCPNKRNDAALAFRESEWDLAEDVVAFLRREVVKEVLGIFEYYGRELQPTTVVEVINVHLQRLPFLQPTPLLYTEFNESGDQVSSRIMLTKALLDIDDDNSYAVKTKLFIDRLIPGDQTSIEHGNSQGYLFLQLTQEAYSVETKTKGYVSSLLGDIQTMMLSAVYIRSATLRAEVDPTGHDAPRGAFDSRSPLVGRKG